MQLYRIGVRLSYLGSEEAPGAASPQAAAQASYRAATVDGYIKLIGTASLGTEEPLGPGCNRGERPDGLLAAEMAVNPLNTRQAARQLADGRNIFGFDVMFTPARPYRTAPGSSNTGLWDEALTAAQYAKQLQNDETAASRAFDQSQGQLRQTIESIRQKSNQAIADLSGCNRNSFTDDAQWFACVDAQICELNLCLKDVQTPKLAPDLPIPAKINEPTPFDVCMERTEAGKPLILTSDAQRLLIDLRTIYVQMVGTAIKANNILKRVELSSQRFAIVKKSLIVSGAAQTVAAVAVNDNYTYSITTIRVAQW